MSPYAQIPSLLGSKLRITFTLPWIVLFATLSMTNTVGASESVLLLDQFGQDKSKNWAGKAQSEEDIKKFDFEEQEELKKSVSVPNKGWISNHRAHKAPPPAYFSISKSGGRWWFVDLYGQPFYSLGIDCVGAGAFSPIREQAVKTDTSSQKTSAKVAKPILAKYDWLPEEKGPFALARNKDSVSFYRANLQRKWGDRWRETFNRRAIQRLESWNFNSFGNWSDEEFQSRCSVPYFSMGPSTWELGINYIDGDIPDVYDPKFQEEATRICIKDFAKTKFDKWLVGYFLDNELPWWNIPYDVLAMDSKAYCRSAWIAKLRSKYGNIQNLNKAWSTNATDFDQLRWAGEKANVVARKDMDELLADFAKLFYAVWYRAMKQADPNHLVLGSRIPYPMDVIVDACARNTDVLSFNNYGIELPKKFNDYYRKYKKPILIGEYNFDSLDAGLRQAAVRVRDQEQRGVAYRFYTEQAAARPYMIGTHYFQYVDEPLTGRSDGESSYNGFVSVVDRPYTELVKAAQKTNQRIHDIHLGKLKPVTQKPICN